MNSAISIILISVVAAATSVSVSAESCSLFKQTCRTENAHCNFWKSECIVPKKVGERCSPNDACDEGLRCDTMCENCVPIKVKLDGAVAFSKDPPKRVHARLLRTAHRCGLSSDASFTNYEDSIISDMPIMYPETQNQLLVIVETAAKNKCKVRAVGATHSSFGVVTGEGDDDTIGVSLAKYASNDASWIDNLDVESQRVRMCAGKSLFDLYELIRPHDLFLPTQTAGPIFTLGGVTANSVHGGVYGKTYLNNYVTAMEVVVMKAGEDGTTSASIEVITEESELKHWRNSFGLLGMITGIEYELDKREGFTQTTHGTTFESRFTRQEVNNYFDDMRENFMYSETFFNPYQKKIQSVVFTSSPKECLDMTDADCTWDFAHAECHNNECCYKKITTKGMCHAKYPSRSHDEIVDSYGALALGFAKIPYFGAPDLSPAKGVLVCLLEELDAVSSFPHFVQSLIQKQFYEQAFNEIADSVKENRNDVNDGFWLRAVPNEYHLMAYALPAHQVYDLLKLISDITEQITEETGVFFIPNVEMRFLTIDGSSSTLQPTNANHGAVIDGEYINCEMVINQYIGSTNKAWLRGLGLFENAMRKMGGIPHVGKSFCYGQAPDFAPYSDQECIESVFSDDQKSEFNTYRTKVDPDGVFFGGDATKFF